MTRVLYITDLDGTLLNDDGKISPYSRRILKRLIENGVLITYATGRSRHSASAIVGNLFQLPVITHNGINIFDSITGRVRINSLDPHSVNHIIKICKHANTTPVIHAIDPMGKERYYWVSTASTRELEKYLQIHDKDPRSRVVSDWIDLPEQNTFRIDVHAREETLTAIEECLKTSDSARPFLTERYSTDPRLTVPRLTIRHPHASKGEAAKTLAQDLSVDSIVAFGNDVNDLSLYKVADTFLIVGEKLTYLSSDGAVLLGCNSKDPVATWLEREFPSANTGSS